jgi:hypothetical protein
MDEQIEVLRAQLDTATAKLAEQQEINSALCRLALALARPQAAMPAVGRAMRDLEALRAIHAGRAPLGQE